MRFAMPLLLTAGLTGCVADNPMYCSPGEGFEACVRLRLNIEGPPDLLGYQIVPLPDMTPVPDLYQCIAPFDLCAEDGKLRPGACCGNYVCFANYCRVGIHGDCKHDADCSPIFVGKDFSPAICFMDHCMSQTGGACSADSDCASGKCGTGNPPRCL